MSATKIAAPPRMNLFRAVADPAEAANDGSTMVGHFAVFDTWTEIDSVFEGHFMERIAPGSFRKTFRENRSSIRPLFQHGQDPQIGDKPLGTVADLREDDTGGYYEVRLLDAPYVRDDLLPGLKAGLYGSSFRFQVMKESFAEEPGISDHNPAGLPERTIKEIRLYEFGPVTFPAYADATAGVRSMTDRFMGAQRMDTEDLSTLAQMIQLGTVYIEEQDEPGDEANVPVMESVLSTLAGLVPYEVAEDEGTEPEDEMASTRRPRDTTQRVAAAAALERKPALATSVVSSRSTPSRDTRFRTDEEWVQWLTNH